MKNVNLFLVTMCIMKLFKIAISILFVLFISISYGQQHFPKSWVGNYEGELQIFGVDSVLMKAEMKLAIQPKTDSIFQYKITYIMNGKKDVRDYELKVKSIEKGQYVIDEKNSILIDAYYKNNTLSSMFTVEHFNLLSSITKHNEDLIFEIISVNTTLSNTSGNTVHNEQQIPKVTSYKISGRQKAILKLVLSD